MVVWSKRGCVNARNNTGCHTIIEDSLRERVSFTYKIIIGEFNSL